MKEILKISAVTIAVAGIIGLAGCGSGSGRGGGGGGDGGGAASSGLTTTGIVSGFGSVYVNGVEYETDSSTFSLDDGDDGPENEGELGIGMVVTLTGTVNPDGVTGTASHIEYDDELEGIVISENIDDVTGTGTMDVMGQIVTVDEATIFESDVLGVTNMWDITADMVVEVSGFPTGDGTIFATRVEVERATHAGEEIEVKGIIKNLNLGTSTFTIGGLTVDFSAALLPDGELVEDLYFEVKSTEGFNASDQLIASVVELEGDGDVDHDGDEGDEFEDYGIVTSVEGMPTEFEINGGLRVLLSEGTSFEHGSIEDIVVDERLEVEGSLDAEGALLASEIEFEEESNIEMEGTLEAVSGEGSIGTITLFGQILMVTPDTVRIDEQDEDVDPLQYFNLESLNAGSDYVEVDAHRDPDTGKLIADKIERDDAPDAGDSSPDELEGPVEDNSTAGELTIAGVRVDVSGLEVPSLSIGDEIEVEGSYIGGGIFDADSIETDD